MLNGQVVGSDLVTMILFNLICNFRNFGLKWGGGNLQSGLHVEQKTSGSIVVNQSK